MAKILGLDLGTNSIGWAVVDSEEKKIIDANVRIFPEGVVKESIGKGDGEQSKNSTRRDSRQSRRQFYRKRLRKIKLLEVLISQKMCPLDASDLKKWKNWDCELKSDGRVFPDTPSFMRWIRMNPYELRSKALTQEVSKEELGRIFYHLIQRRGFLSSRKGKEDTSIFTKGNSDENILSINYTKEQIENTTLGAYLYHISRKNNEEYKPVFDENGVEVRLRGRYTVREMYIAEFEKIWQKQAPLLGIENTTISVKKIREFRGSITGSRSQKRLENLKLKYGKSNVIVGEKSKKGITKVTTTSSMSLKKYLGGEISEIENEEGNKKLIFKSNESVLFWQRPLRSQKGLLANCRFENNLPVITANDEYRKNREGEIQYRSKKPAPLSHPEFEIFRAYQFINNIKYGKNQKLSSDQKQTVLKLINKKDANFDFIKIPQELKLTYEKFNYDDKLKAPSSPTIKQLQPLFDKSVWEENYEQIWHCFYFYDDTDKLFEKLVADFKYNKGIEKLNKVRLKDGYGNVSLKAIRNILPFLEKGYQFDRAVILGGVRNAFGKRWDYFKDYHLQLENEIISILNEDNKDGEAIEKIKEHLSSPVYSYGFSKNDPWFQHLYHHSQDVDNNDELRDYVPEIENLRNPIVQQGLYEVRRVVNSLISKYKKEFGEDFHFDRINVEMGRDLKNNKSQRQKIGKQIRDNEKKNDEARARLSEFGLQSSRANVQKYLMFKEIEERAGKAQCPYTGKIISLNDLLGDRNVIQIEHIIPFSISLDDAFGNKTLSESNFNREKGEKTPYQFYLTNPDSKLWGASSWAEIEARAFRILPYNKAKRFTSKKIFENSSFIERQLNDSRYIARKSVEILSNVCNDVRVMPGRLTAELRHLWGLNDVMESKITLDNVKFDVDEHKPTHYYVTTDENNNILSLQRKTNEKPEVEENSFLLAGLLKKEKFESKNYQLTIAETSLKDGKYWLKLDVGNNIKLVPKYSDKPIINQNEIVFKGRIDRNSFRNDTTGNIRVDMEDGQYWAKFNILDAKFEVPVKDKQPKSKRNQILLYGNVTNGEFSCFIYRCKTNLDDGKYWIILSLDYDNIDFIPTENPVPQTHSGELLITATINENGLLTADEDKDFTKQTDNQNGKYYAVLDISSTDSNNPELFRIENNPPIINKGEKLKEGSIWVDKYTGEIKFDAKKNREDHRHHTIDAIVIALTEQRFLQQLSTYNAQRKDKQRGKLDSTEKFPEPWLNFDNDVRKVVNGIIVSYTKSNKVLTKNKKGFSVRGQLHKENVFGKRCAPNEKDYGYHRKTKITALDTDKKVAKVVDVVIRGLIKKHLQENCNINTNEKYKIPKDAFYKEGKWQIFLPNKNGDKVPVKKVRIRETIGNAVKLKSGVNQHVNPRNNHHVLIYKNKNGDLCENVVAFWDVTKRLINGEKKYQLPKGGEEIITTLEINDMFLLGLSDSEFENNINNGQFLSNYLYRVQKLSSGDYSFRFHLASTILKQEEEWRISSFSAFEKANPIKIKITELGQIKKI